MARKWNLRSRIIASSRKIFYYSPIRREALKRAKVGKYYRCFKCKGLHDRVQLDHAQPVINIKEGWQGYDVFMERLFCDVDNLQGLCAKCHTKKTKAEQKLRKKYKKEKIKCGEQ